jgi:hypothetical protein
MTQAWTLDAAQAPERVAMLEAQLSRDAGIEQQQRTARNTAGTVSALSALASALAVYDVLTLVSGMH